VNTEQIVAEIAKYETELASILPRFTRGNDSMHIGLGDEPIFRQYVRELVDLFNDVLGPNSYGQIASEFSQGISNFTLSPSYKSVRTSSCDPCGKDSLRSQPGAVSAKERGRRVQRSKARVRADRVGLSARFCEMGTGFCEIRLGSRCLRFCVAG